MNDVLIIEDTEDNLVLISVLLTKAGYSVRAARSGVEGVEMALRQRPDFILLDIQLPDIDGYEVVARLRRSGINGGLPIIAMTSYAMTGDRERLLAAGCSGYIEKPIDPLRVVEQIRQALGPAG